VSVDPPLLYPDYRSTQTRAPSRPLLPLPEELARRQPAARVRGRSPRHVRAAT
jgi:hypothetical protein